MFFIGAQKWSGVSKLMEECGEVLQACGKLIATRGEVKHWDGGPPLDERLIDEMADLFAAIKFVVHHNFDNAPGDRTWPGLSPMRQRFSDRVKEKMERFDRWHADEGKLIFERLHAEGGPISDVTPRVLSCGCSALEHPDTQRLTLGLPPYVCALGWPKK